MKSIGIVVCNYNKQDYVVKCIESIFNSSIKDFKATLSVSMVKKIFADKVTIIQNSQNLGGSGGFNTGIKEVLNREYDYLMCVDNDIVFDAYAIEELRNFLELHSDVGMVGSRCYFMDNYRNQTDKGDVPDIAYGDYVPACSLMARIEAVRKVGLMPEDNFIYWDDMEWGYRFNQMGYKVAAYGKSKVWHKGGGRNAGNTFINYYIWRNRMRFFLKVLKQDELEHFTETILGELFRTIYSCNLKGETNIIKSLMYAFDDAIHGISGKAAEYKILTRNQSIDKIKIVLDECKSILIKFNGDFEGLGNIIRSIYKHTPDIHISISIENCITDKHFLESQYPECQIVETDAIDEYEKKLCMCPHIFQIEDSNLDEIYIDGWCNIVDGERDLTYIQNYEECKKLFVLCRKDLIMNSNLRC